MRHVIARGVASTVVVQRNSGEVMVRLIRMALLVSTAALGFAPLGVDSATCATSDPQKSCGPLASHRVERWSGNAAERVSLAEDLLSLEGPINRGTHDVANPQRPVVDLRHAQDLLLSAPQRPLAQQKTVDPFENRPERYAEPKAAVRSNEPAQHDEPAELSVAWPLLLGLLFVILRRARLRSFSRGSLFGASRGLRDSQ